MCAVGDALEILLKREKEKITKQKRGSLDKRGWGYVSFPANPHMYFMLVCSMTNNGQRSKILCKRR